MQALELFFIVALACYTLAIHVQNQKNTLRTWMMVVFGAGLISDALGTVFLCVVNADVWQFTTHSVSGLAALLIMALHFMWGMTALRKAGNWAVLFHKWSIWAWLLWILAFVSGIPAQWWYQALIGLFIIALTYLVHFIITR